MDADAELKEKMKAGMLIGKEVRVRMANQTLRAILWGFDEEVIIIGDSREVAIPVYWDEFKHMEAV